MALIALGCGAYGFTVGLRNGWEMGAYVAVKLPLIIFITLIVNGLLNGLLGLVLGSGIGFRKSVQFLLTGFAIMAVILARLVRLVFLRRSTCRHRGMAQVGLHGTGPAC